MDKLLKDLHPLNQIIREYTNINSCFLRNVCIFKCVVKRVRGVPDK